MTKHIAVIGGGMAGTSAAHFLMQRGYKVTIIEKNDYLGGRMHTHLVNGAAVEMGAGFMSRLYTNLLTFLKSADLGTQLCRQDSISGIVRGGEIRMATLRTLVGNSALSLRAKLRIASLIGRAVIHWPQLDHHAVWKADRYDNRSVEAMLSGKDSEQLEYFWQPLVNGYCYWTPEHVSEAMLLSICRAAITQGPSLKMRVGLQCIPETAARGATVLLSHSVRSVRRRKDKTYEVTVAHGDKSKVLRADGIVCATTASAVPVIFPDLSKRQKGFFRAVQYSSTVLIARTYEHQDTRGNKSIAFPRREGIELSAVTLARQPGDAGNLATLKTYASGTIGKQLCKESDKAIIRKLTSMMEPVREAVLIGNPKPVATHVQKWPEALPFFDVGHFKRLREFVGGEIEDPGEAVVFAGDYLVGPFMEGAFTSGMEAAERLISRLRA